MFKSASPWFVSILVIAIVRPYAICELRGAEPIEPLGLRRVELFPAGLGIFEYQSKNTSETELSLDLLPHELDDLLKSMVLKGFESGRVHYHLEANQTEYDHLAFQTDSTATRSEILQGMIGIEVSVQDGSKVRVGRIVSLELQTQATPNGNLECEILTLSTENGLEQMELNHASVVSLADPKTKEGFERALLKMGRSGVDRLPIHLKLSKKDPGPAAVAFQTESAPWRCSYRIAKIDDEFQLVASAVIDNNSGTDWNDIELVLVIDQPLGFHSTLSQVQQTYRDNIEVPTLFSSAPPLLSAGTKQESPLPIAADASKSNLDPFSPGSVNPGFGGGMGGMGGMGGGMGGMGGATGMSLVVTAPQETGAKLGASDLNDPFAKRLGLSFTPDAMASELIGERVKICVPNVTLEAMASQTVFLPKIPHRIRPVAVHLTEMDREHAFAAFEITLLHGYQLMPGPGSVWNDQGYLGDVMFPRLVSDVPQLVTYALDRSISVSSEALVEKKLPSKWEIVKNQKLDLIYERTSHERMYRYVLRNEGAESKTVMIEHAQRDGAWVPDPVKADIVGKQKDIFRYETIAKGNSKTNLDVRETRSGLSEWNADSTYERLVDLKKRSDLPIAMAELVTGWIERQEYLRSTAAKIVALDKKIKTLIESIDQSERQQKRIQELLKALIRDDDLHTRYVKKLSSLEDEIESTSDELKAVKLEREAMLTR
jgi:hypothetical protein